MPDPTKPVPHSDEDQLESLQPYVPDRDIALRIALSTGNGLDELIPPPTEVQSPVGIKWFQVQTAVEELMARTSTPEERRRLLLTLAQYQFDVTARYTLQQLNPDEPCLIQQPSGQQVDVWGPGGLNVTEDVAEEDEGEELIGYQSDREREITEIIESLREVVESANDPNVRMSAYSKMIGYTRRFLQRDYYCGDKPVAFVSRAVLICEKESGRNGHTASSQGSMVYDLLTLVMDKGVGDTTGIYGVQVHAAIEKMCTRKLYPSTNESPVFVDRIGSLVADIVFDPENPFEALHLLYRVMTEHSISDDGMNMLRSRLPFTLDVIMYINNQTMIRHNDGKVDEVLARKVNEKARGIFTHVMTSPHPLDRQMQDEFAHIAAHILFR